MRSTLTACKLMPGDRISPVGLLLVVLLVGVCPSRAWPAPITADNWTTAVGFAPDLSSAVLKSAKKVTAANADRFDELLPAGLKILIRKYGLEMRLVDYRPVHPSAGYIEATNRYRGQAAIVDVGQAVDRRGISGYRAGLPFPQPADGLQVAWDFHYAYGGDDAEVYYTVFWVSAASGVEHSERWRLSVIRASGRTDIEPLPEISSMAKKGLQGAGLTYALAPYDKKGFGAVYFMSVEPHDGQGHTYVPSMRRILRNSFGTRGDTWNGTDLLYEDVRGYSGYPEWMRWKLVEKKTVLLPMHAGAAAGRKGAQKTYHFGKRPHFNPRYKWEPRPVYLLSAVPKLPDYPYSKQLLYVDAETFQVLYKESFDRKGALWKVMINCGSKRTDGDNGRAIFAWGGSVVVDLQSEHATVFHVYKSRANVGLDPDMFSVSSLRKRAK